ncbi:MFS transporter [Pseudonocardia ailaonensis]|uniref:MFS transporter n=1 Tax=Pseudonocardia ailaonensis TaxID=367279 RepID=UPI0031D5EB35
MSAPEAVPVDSARLDRRVALKIIPFVFLLFFVAYTDRIALSYAGPAGMNSDLALTSTAFGFAAGIFFLGYLLVEIPSNIIMQRVGARRWLARIILSWGIVQVAMAFAPNAEILYVLRFLLGVAEGGFAPGVILYLTLWFSSAYRGRALSRFLVAPVTASIVGAPLAIGLIAAGNSAQLFGLSGWRFLILVTGVPAVVLGVVTWFYLADGPEKARWLSRAERDDIATRLADTQGHEVNTGGVKAALRDRRVWLLGLCNFSFVYGGYTLTFFLPTIVSGFQAQFNVSFTQIQGALLIAVPFAVGGAAQLWFGRHTDRRGHIGAHIAAACAFGLVGGLGATLARDPYTLIAFICLMAVGIYAGGTLALILVSNLYVGPGSATAIALVNSIGVPAGFAGPYLTGWLRDLTGAESIGLILVTVLLVISGVIGIVFDRRRRTPSAPAPHQEAV